MAIKTYSQIVQSFQDGIRLRQPTLDTKPGSVSRDLFIDNPADQIASVYRDMQLIQRTQSILNATGQILDQYGSNYDIIRDTGKRSVGNAILTFNNLLNNINISSGTTVTSKTGVSFRITANIVVSAATKGIYASFASSISNQLHIAGISDQYAVSVPIEAINIGTNGNIPVYSLVKTSISGISNVTNITPTSGGTNKQGDSKYRSQIIAGLSGSAAGTARGYQNALLTVSGIQSVFIATPGNPILTRDGTITNRRSDGTLFVLSPGTGGKVDVWIQGNDFIDITESYVFHDVSGTGNAASSLNAHILGQTTNTATLTPLERRQLFTQTGQLPLQPIDSIININGSVSGANFVNGVNYSVVHDTNPETENTAFALDKIVFLQNYISIAAENIPKGESNSVDSTVFNGIKSIDNVNQQIIVTNDLATLDISDHTKITVSHNPLNTVLRATNLTTGERYVITDQNINAASGLNESGQVTISGSILPSSQDLIQVDYIWDIEYEPTTDYFEPNTSEFVSNAVDWGKSNSITLENALLIRNGNRYNLNVLNNVDRVFNAFYCDTQITTVQQANLIDQTNTIKAIRQVTISSGAGAVIYFVVPGIQLITANVVAGSIVHISLDTATTSRDGVYVIASIIDETIFKIAPVSPLLVVETGNATIEIRASNDTTVLISATPITGLNTAAEDISNITNVVSVVSQVTGLELFTTKNGGTFSGNVVYLATDVAQPEIDEEVIVYFSAHELFNISKNNGSLDNNSIILSTDDVLDFNSVLTPLDDIYNGVSIKPILVNYVATDIDIVGQTAISLMPFIGSTSLSVFVDKNNNSLVSRQPTEFDLNNKITRNGPSYLSLVIDGAFSSGGTIAIKGTGWLKINTSIQVSQNNVSGIFDMSNIIQTTFGSLSSNYTVVKVVSASINNGVETTDLLLRGYKLNNNLYDVGVAVAALELNDTSVDLSNIFQQNDITLLTIGSILNITFYISAPNIAETIQFTNGRGTLYSRKKYTRIDRIELISGFLNPSTLAITGNITVNNLSQPSTSSTYLADYSYFAPVENERITIQYRYNNVIQTATAAIENVRTLTADVLTRLGVQVVVNVSMTVILDKQAINQQQQIIDQSISAINNLITSNTLNNNLLDYSSFLRVVTAISGVSGADVTVFDYSGSEFDGQANRKFIQADANQYFAVGTINVTPGIR